MRGSERGYLCELFTSVQGEGLFAGTMQHFFRMSGCETGCGHCDTPDARHRTQQFKFCGEQEGVNPVDPAEASDLLSKLDRLNPLADGLAVTGGEPLEQAGFLSSFLPIVRNKVLKGRPIILETAGLHPREMRTLSGLVDWVSMDIKLFSVCAVRNSIEKHKSFLQAVPGDTGLYVKAVVNKNTTAEEVSEAASIVSARDSRVPFFIQPEKKGDTVAGGVYLIELWKAAKKEHDCVKVLPQIHGFLSLR